MDFKPLKIIQNIFSVDLTVCSTTSLHVVFDIYNMCNALSKRGKRYTYQNILLLKPRGTLFGFLLANIFTPLPCRAYCVLYTLQCLAYLKKHIIATETIHVYPFQQKLYRPTFPSSHDTGVAIMVSNILIISKNISDHIRRCT